MRFPFRSLLILLTFLNAVVVLGQTTKSLKDVYRDESHCLTAADMRNDSDMLNSCYCRDSVVDARYVYSQYLLRGIDDNLNGPFLHLVRAITAICGSDYEAMKAATQKQWEWTGPEILRTYPPDDVIKSLKLEYDGSTKGRWVPFTVVLRFRDPHGVIVRTETYSSREFVPEFSPVEQDH